MQFDSFFHVEAAAIVIVYRCNLWIKSFSLVYPRKALESENGENYTFPHFRSLSGNCQAPLDLPEYAAKFS